MEITVKPVPTIDIMKKYEDHETTDESEESEQEMRAMSFDLAVLNKKIDLKLLDRKKYNTPQAVFNFFHSKSENPNEKMTREEVENIIEKYRRI